MVGGDKEVFEKTRPFLEAMGKKIYYCGPSGMGLNAKLTQNLILSNILALSMKAWCSARKPACDPDLMLEILANSAAKSGLIEYKAPLSFAATFPQTFPQSGCIRTLDLCSIRVLSSDVPLPLTAVTRQMFQMAISSGYGDDDMCSTIQVLEKMSGVEVKKS